MFSLTTVKVNQKKVYNSTGVKVMPLVKHHLQYYLGYIELDELSWSNTVKQIKVNPVQEKYYGEIL